MGRRGVIVATLAAVLVVLAAASGPVRVWTTPDVGPSTVDTLATGETIPLGEPVVNDSSASRRWNSAPLQIVAVLIILAALSTVAVFGESWRPNWRRRRKKPSLTDIDALPEPAANELTVDVDAARAVLAAGDPRNAIVACWMQLERDAASAGLARSGSETSAEYAERVVASSSVDAAPIGELAALYREARFSRHDLNDDHRSRAFAALNRVAAALRGGVKVAT